MGIKTSMKGLFIELVEEWGMHGVVSGGQRWQARVATIHYYSANSSEPYKM